MLIPVSVYDTVIYTHYSDPELVGVSSVCLYVYVAIVVPEDELDEREVTSYEWSRSGGGDSGQPEGPEEAGQ